VEIDSHFCVTAAAAGLEQVHDDGVEDAVETAACLFSRLVVALGCCHYPNLLAELQYMLWFGKRNGAL
jgi:hypothetical protein